MTSALICVALVTSAALAAVNPVYLAQHLEQLVYLVHLVHPEHLVHLLHLVQN